MLTCSSFCNYSFFSHFLGQEALAQTVVSFMCSAMQKILSLEKNLCTAYIICQILCKKERCRSSCIIFKIIVKFLLETSVVFNFFVCLLKFINCLNQSFWNILASVFSVFT